MLQSTLLALLLCHSANAQYFDITSGSCVSNGYSMVTNWHHCKVGSQSNSNPLHRAEAGVPPGCSLAVDLWLNLLISSTTECSPNYRCVCFNGGDCANTNGITINPNPCYCGITTCTAESGLYCFESSNLCSTSNSFVRISSGACEDVADRSPLFTIADCNFAAGALSLLDTTSILLSSLSSPDAPRGCFTNTVSGSAGLTTNQYVGSITRCSPTQICICQIGTACANTDGTQANSIPCMCGTSFCTTNTGLVCDLSTANRGGTGQCSTTTSDPWYVKSTTTCDNVGGVKPRTTTDCRNAALAYGLIDTIPSTGFDSNRTSGCYFDQNKKLHFNTNIRSLVMCGEYGTTCLCYTAAACDQPYGVSVSTGAMCGCGTSLCSPTTGRFCYRKSNSCISRNVIEANIDDFLRFQSAIGQQ